MLILQWFYSGLATQMMLWDSAPTTERAEVVEGGTGEA